jgi:hypothetical protein
MALPIAAARSYPNMSTLEVIFDKKREELKDTKEVIRIRKSKNNRQHSGQKKKYKITNTICKTYTLN